MFLEKGGKYLSTHQPAPHQAGHCTPGLSSPCYHLCDLCILHDIKAIWIHIEQGLGFREVILLSVASAGAREALCYWVGLVSIRKAWKEESFS